ncbi:BREX-1 system phosphatase PglZ type B [Pseudomaricurvus alcaniphilus]|uniref:BREX-1 system phosphatase PglZ type B n=1 Tax=Pseudomaricurvus alcaniphilus TaxID=1166482 RepID=UPI0014081805|nr:BREX-1 system phosphatase PglZ type B [Pseudomaricurvus alcaniphilus]NHN36559.1 BREX-1 system phosphatase PglZ type B [Pseudomaricurvus alcaniphilus]
MSTVLDSLVGMLRASAAYNPNVQQVPVAILWTDKEKQWLPVLPLLREALPEMFTLGDYQPEARMGPPIWLKCVIANRIEQYPIDDSLLPILYLPGVSRQDFRAIEQCPEQLKPLAELQYRGVLWSQLNGKDWTVNAYLTSGAGGLGLDVAQDKATQNALLLALEAVLAASMQQVDGKRLEASDFHQLVSGDPVRDLLAWMNSPAQVKQQWPANRWQALCNLAQAEFGLNIESDGEYAAAEKLCQCRGAWEQVWQRYCDSPALFPGIPALLERVPPADMLADPATYPQANTNEEQQLLTALTEIKTKTPAAARKQLLVLERQHHKRRASIWAQLGKAPWALLLAPLAEIAGLSQQGLNGLSAQELGQRYAEQGWKIDALAIDALGQCDSKQQRSVVETVLAVIYTPWLTDVTERFQQQVKEKGYPGDGAVAEAVVNYQIGGEVVFFVDGLRLDVAHKLQALLLEKGIEPTLATQWSALPSVTATAKAAVSPIHPYLQGVGSDKDFEPSVKGEGTLSHDRFKKLLAKHGWQHLADDDTGDPTGNAWVACGDIDKEGHRSELKLAARLGPILHGIVERVVELQQAGWRKIRLVTDHGWLLVPGNMPKADLPVQAADSRWGRCAQLKQNVSVEGLTLGWHWNRNIPIHFPQGIHSFIAGRAYGHGGISLQECLVPVLTIAGEVKSRAQAAITSVRWLGMTCKVEVDGEGEDFTVDLRTKLADSATSLVNPKALASGKANLKVLDDDNEGVQAMVVVLDSNGEVLAKQATTVGGED